MPVLDGWRATAAEGLEARPLLVGYYGCLGSALISTVRLWYGVVDEIPPLLVANGP